MPDIPTQIRTDLDADDWAVRLLSTFPAEWAGETARAPGGKLYSLFKAVGAELEVTNNNLLYVFHACRLMTAEGEALDLVANDFLGPAYGFPALVTRVLGESDEAFRQRIIDNMFLPAATRPALIKMIERFTGLTPRVIEPWRLQDTGAFDANSYWDVDNQQAPARWANPALRWKGAFISPLPRVKGLKSTGFVAFDANGFWDASFYTQFDASWFLNAARLDELVNRVKAYGTKVFRQYNNQFFRTQPTGGSYTIREGNTFRDVTLSPPFNSPFAVLTNANWNTTVSTKRLPGGGFRLIFSTAAPQGARCDWIAASLLTPGFGQLRIRQDAISQRIGVPAALSSYVLIVTPNWNTALWLDVDATDSTHKAINFSAVPAPSGAAISYGFFPTADGKAGKVEIPPGTTQFVIPIKTRRPFEAFAMAEWNTQVLIDKTPNTLTFTFAQPPDDTQNLYWAIFEP